MAAIDLQPPPGVRDSYPDEMRRRRWLFGHWRAVAESFGYEEYDACVLEHAQLYIRKAGDEITQQLFDFRDKGDRHVALRPELTPSLARMVMARQGSLRLPLRWWSTPQCFRYERVQKGRKREHYQWNLDCIGLSSVAAEAELMAAQCAFLAAVGLTEGIELRVSDRRVIEAFLTARGVDSDGFQRVCVVIDKFHKIGAEAVRELLLKPASSGEGREASEPGAGLDAATADAVLGLLQAEGLAGLLAVAGDDNPGVASLRELQTLAEAAGFAALLRIDPTVVRGLSYYTGTVWEVFDATGANPRAIAGGGRYDRLIEQLGGTPLPMVGFGFGDVVIMDVLEARGLVPELPRQVEAIIYPMSAELFPLAARIAAAQRAAGKRILVDWALRRFKHVIAGAEADGASELIILGKDEVAKGVAKIRRIGGEREEREVALSELGA